MAPVSALLLPLVVFLLSQGCEARLSRRRERLLQKLFSGYQKEMRPNENGNATLVRLSVSLRDINEVQEGTLSATIKATAWVSLSWRDDRLSWDLSFPTKYFIIDQNKLWIPDIRLQNSLDPRPRTDKDVKAVVHRDGRIDYITPTWLTVHCSHPQVPTATWQCSFTFASWVYNAYQLDIYSRQNGMDTMSFTNKMWGVTANHSRRNVVVMETASLPWVDITYSLRILRR